MKIKKFFSCFILITAAVFCMAGCSSVSDAENEAIHRQLMGSWVLLNDNELETDADGNVVKFSVFEFLETETRYHVVQTTVTDSYPLNEYTIYDGKYKVITDKGAQFSGIRFTETGNLVLYTDSTSDEFRRLTEEEIAEFGIPVNRPGLFDNTDSGAASSEAAAE